MRPKAVLGPRLAPDPAAVEAFVSGRAEIASAPSVPAPSHTSAQAPGGRVVHVRKDGRQLRRTTIYMPVGLATRVGVFAVTRGVDQTDVIREALEGYLATRGA
jgi:hypothetical protein